MNRPEEVRRIYHKSDDEVMQQSDLKLASFNENKSQFVEHFTQLDDPFADEWDSATMTARNIVPDYSSVANQSYETDALKALVTKGANHYQSVLLYVRLAFPDDAAILKVFGQPKYEAARSSHVKLPGLLRSTYTQTTTPQYKAALMAKGLKEAEIEMIKTLADDIDNQVKIQEKAMNDRTLDANARITALNTVWEMMALVCQCAKLVFQNDVTRYNMFLLSDGDNQTSRPDDNPSQPENGQ